MHSEFYFKGKYKINPMKTMPCYVLFYNTFIIICVVDPKIIKGEVQKIKSKEYIKKTSLFERPILIKSEIEEYGKVYADMDYEKVLEINEKSKMIKYKQISDVSCHCNRTDISGESLVSNAGRLVINLNGETITICHDYDECSPKLIHLMCIIYSKLNICHRKYNIK